MECLADLSVIDFPLLNLVRTCCNRSITVSRPARFFGDLTSGKEGERGGERMRSSCIKENCRGAEGGPRTWVGCAVHCAVNESNSAAQVGRTHDPHPLVGLSSWYRYNPSQVPGVPSQGCPRGGIGGKGGAGWGARARKPEERTWRSTTQSHGGALRALTRQKKISYCRVSLTSDHNTNHKAGPSINCTRCRLACIALLSDGQIR